MQEFTDHIFIYLNEENIAKRYRVQIYYLPRSIIKDYNVTINGKKFYDQPIDCDIKRYKEIRKLITGQSEDYTTGCLLGYNYIQNLYRLMAASLSLQFDTD